MNYIRKYQYYVLIEINNGNIIEHRPIKFSENLSFKQEIINCFHRRILEIASNEPIAVFDISDYFEFEIIKSRGDILNFNRLRLISNLILVNNKNVQFAKLDLSIPNEIEYLDNLNSNQHDSDEVIMISDSYREYYKSKNENIKQKQTDYTRNYLAVFYYLAYNDQRYISNVTYIDYLISLFFKNYLVNENINFKNVGSAYMSNDYQIIKESKIGETINIQYSHSNGIKSFFLTNITTMRDIESEYILKDFIDGSDGGYDWTQDCNIWVVPDDQEIRIAMAKERNKWENDFLNTLKEITLNSSSRFFIKASFNYPIIQNKFHYNLL